MNLMKCVARACRAFPGDGDTHTRPMRTPIPYTIHGPFALMGAACLCVVLGNTELTAQMIPGAEPNASARDQRHVHTEMIAVLEAYAVYKMGDFDEAFLRWRALAEQGYAQGMLNTANMLAAGRGTAQDVPAALDWYRLGAAAGDGESARGVAAILAAHPELAQDGETARAALEQAARLGAVAAIRDLGCALVDEGDLTDARDWLEQAIRQGARDADACLARLPLGVRAATGTSPVPARDRHRVTRMLANMTAAANVRDVDWLLSQVAQDATIQVRFVDDGTRMHLTRDELHAFWTATLGEVDRYDFRRLDTRITADADGLRSDSRILETFGTSAVNTKIILEETLRFQETPGARLTIGAITMALSGTEGKTIMTHRAPAQFP